MTANFVITKSYPAPRVDRREALRYAGVRGDAPEMAELMDSCVAEACDKLKYSLCYREYEIKADGGELDLGFARTGSKSLAEALSGCNKIILFCATVGVEMDRLIAKYSLLSPARSVMLQALGSERVEALCDAFCEDKRAETLSLGGSLTRRFSPGYGDLPLELQRDIFIALEPHKNIGVSLGADLFMTPTKSVTAIIGVKM